MTVDKMPLICSFIGIRFLVLMLLVCSMICFEPPLPATIVAVVPASAELHFRQEKLVILSKPADVETRKSRWSREYRALTLGNFVQETSFQVQQG